MKRALVVTTINGAENRCLQLLARGASEAGIAFFIAGDTRTPVPFSLAGATFLSLEEQALRFRELCAVLPTKHYARKNVAYLAAIQDGADEIQETDDDNFPGTEFWETTTKHEIKAETVFGRPWVNVYMAFSRERVWPRGLPLEYVQDSKPTIRPDTSGRQPLVLQGLADANPDVDAVFRLTRDLPLSFTVRAPVFVEPWSWCPFNSQNTIFNRRVYPLMYLPSYCSFRMTDIWRSFVAQRCLWELGAGVIFHQATVHQERNDHRLLKDFEEEIPGYLYNEQIRLLLEQCTLDPGDTVRNLIVCYEALIAGGFIPPEEMNVLRAWVHSLQQLGSW